MKYKRSKTDLLLLLKPLPVSKLESPIKPNIKVHHA